MAQAMNRLRQVGEAAAFAGSVSAVAARIAANETAHIIGSALRKPGTPPDAIQDMIDDIDKELQEQSLWKDHINTELAMCETGIASAIQARRQDEELKAQLEELPKRAQPGYIAKVKQTPLEDNEVNRVEAQPLALLRHAADLITRGLRPDTGTHFRTNRDNLTAFMRLAVSAAPDATIADLRLDTPQMNLLDKVIWSNHDAITA